MRSPDSSSTPAARSASTRIRFTGERGADLRPGAVAERASASQSAPTPPRGCDRPPPAAACAASRYSSVSTVPGERGPKFVPSTASNPSAPLSSGVSKCSSSRSYTFMPPMRSSSRMSRAPELADLPAEPRERREVLPVGGAEARRYAGEQRHQRLARSGAFVRCRPRRPPRPVRLIPRPPASGAPSGPQGRGGHGTARPT